MSACGTRGSRGSPGALGTPCQGCPLSQAGTSSCDKQAPPKVQCLWVPISTAVTPAVSLLGTPTRPASCSPSDVPQINDKLGGDETLLNILYDFLDHEPPLNPLLASFFSKTIGNLIARKTETGRDGKKDKFLSLVLKHIDTSAMMDLLLRLISCVEPAALRQDVRGGGSATAAS
uniref:Uncharacterized protein n=1 Tax=Malurus cyaneus samueli TaxID=2593467 RepID=A0A8C5TBR5_9PASS